MVLEDTRYSVLGIINLYILQQFNGIFDTIQEKIPGIQIEGNDDFEMRKMITIKVMNRKRYVWAIQCEASTGISANIFFQAIYNLRPYFYPIDTMLRLLNLGYNHSHNNLIGHDDYHGEKSKEAHTLDKFHLHTEGAPVEVNSEVIRKCYGFILLFTIGVGMHYVIFVSRKPKPASTLVV